MLAVMIFLLLRRRKSCGAKNGHHSENLAPSNNETANPQDERGELRCDEGESAGEGLPGAELIAAVSGSSSEVDRDWNERMGEKREEVDSLKDVAAVLLFVELLKRRILLFLKYFLVFVASC